MAEVKALRANVFRKALVKIKQREAKHFGKTSA